jgi:integral membrane protein
LSASENIETAAAATSTATPAAPTRGASPAKVRPAFLRYRVLAWATGTWLLLLCAEMIAKYGFGVHTPNWIAVVHGWCYFVYLIFTADLAVKVRWPVGRTIGTLLAGTIPLLSFVVEHINAKQVKEKYNF